MSELKKPAIVFRPSAPGLQKFMGKLEADVMEIVWENGPLTVKRALFFISHKHHYAYTTIMTVMNKLTQKGMLSREKSGHSFVYSAQMGKEQFLGFAVKKVISSLQDDFGAIVSSFLAVPFRPHKKGK
jgi:predicted transcriptional regulator